MLGKKSNKKNQTDLRRQRDKIPRNVIKKGRMRDSYSQPLNSKVEYNIKPIYGSEVHCHSTRKVQINRVLRFTVGIYIYLD